MKKGLSFLWAMLFLFGFFVSTDAVEINVISVTASSETGAGYAAEHLIDGSGLDAANQHGEHYMDMWMSETGDVIDAWLQFDFGSSYTVTSMDIWQYNYDNLDANPLLLDRGVKDFKLYSSTDGINFTFAGDFSLSRAPGEPVIVAEPIPFDPSISDVVSIKFILKSNFGENNIGLSEVKFYGDAVIPEPTTLALLGIGALGLLGYGWKSRKRG